MTISVTEWRRCQIAAQERWVEEHGGTIAGYVARYGSAEAPGHFGDGGEAIFRADTTALANMKRKMK